MDVVDTVKEGAKSWGMIIKGDFGGALDEIKKIPIVQDTKQDVDTLMSVADGVSKGDWDKVKDNLLDLGLIAADFVPIPGGKVIGKLGKRIEQKIEDIKSRVKRKSKREEQGNEQDVLKKKPKRNSNKDKEDDNAPDHCTRAIGKRARPLPGAAPNINCRDKTKGDNDKIKSDNDKIKSDNNAQDNSQKNQPHPGTLQASRVVNAKCSKRVIGYYTSWGDTDFSYSQASMLTHVVYAFLEMQADGSIKIGSADPTHATNVAGETAKAEKRLRNLLDVVKANSNSVKVMFAVGCWENSQYYSIVAANPKLRLNFIALAIKMIDEHGFNRIDINWEYPVTGGAHEGTSADKGNYVTLMCELRSAFDEHQKVKNAKDPYLISFTGAAGQWTLDPGFDLPELLKYANWVNVMMYDYFGPWASKWGAYTGPPAPLFFAMPPKFSGKTNVDFTLKYYTCRIKEPHKINMGVPFYGRYWENVGDAIDASDQMWRGAGAVGGQYKGGYSKWREIAQGWIDQHSLQKHYHDKAKSPYAFNVGSKMFLGYEDQQSLQEKIKYAADKNLGGLMVWAVDLDDDKDTMLQIVAQGDLCGNTNPKDIMSKDSKHVYLYPLE